MLNIEKYKDQILNIQKEKWLSIECAIGNVRGVHLPCNQKCRECELLSLIWLSEEYKEPVLDEVEREYLKAVIRPFRNKIDTISKFRTWDDNSQYIYIKMKDNNYSSNLPCFPKGTMYKGMEVGKYYTLQELGL